MFVVDAFLIGAAVDHASLRPVPVAAEEPLDEDDPEPRTEIVHADQAGPVDLQPASASAPAPKPFDLGGAYGAIAQVDLASCKAEGLAPGYGHVVLGFLPDGSVGGVAVQLPPSSSPWAHACVESALRGVRVSPFAGDQPATVRRELYVK
jgi:hypothetical protein